ncbi:MAG: dNTP triphosphohydrolase [Bacteroidota bacterium]|nr:dNTP triphosphohydrolase [Bacteroidota bacterium]
MQWDKLLSLRRFGDTETRIRKKQDPTRVGFEVDYDRIIFSAAFRALQDKTQVIPLSKTDFVHTRLTHSLEVSVVGRSLGRSVGQFILSKYPHLQDLGYTVNDFGAILAAASVAHDIGNPPFGHSGEKAISEYFLNGKGKRFQSELSDSEYQDLISFEGNANGISVLCSSMYDLEGGLRLSYATIGAFMKYPKESLPVKPTTAISNKKYGFFQSDKPFIQEVAQELGLIPSNHQNYVGYLRHPLAFLVEAADDICYTITDFEDGINLGWINEEFALEYLQDIVKDSIKTKYYSYKVKEHRVAYLRALAIGSMIQEVITVFKNNEELILKGAFNHSLTQQSKFKNQLDYIIRKCVDNLYQSTEVTQKEIIGHKIIATLLDTFISAYNNKYLGTETTYDKLILRLLPEKHQLYHSDSLYLRLLSICHFVSLLTDGNALELYKIIQGNKI